MKYTQVKNCKWANQEHTAINCEVLFDTLGWVSFTAAANDVDYSVDIYNKAKNGEFGNIEPYAPIEINTVPVTAADSVRSKRNRLLTNLDLVVCNPLRWANFSSAEQANFAQYRQQLLDVPQQAGFPDTVVWPVPPANVIEPQEFTFSL